MQDQDCQINEEKECDRIIRGKNPIKLKQHLSKSHPNQYAQLLEKEEQLREPYPFNINNHNYYFVIIYLT